jgi:hypothetical protein
MHTWPSNNSGRRVLAGKSRGFGLTRGAVLSPGCNPAEGPGMDRTNLHIGIGIAQMSRRGIFTAKAGVAVVLDNRVFDIPPFPGTVRILRRQICARRRILLSYASTMVLHLSQLAPRRRSDAIHDIVHVLYFSADISCLHLSCLARACRE